MTRFVPTAWAEPEPHFVVARDGAEPFSRGDPAICKRLLDVALRVPVDGPLTEALDGGLITHARRRAGGAVAMAARWDTPDEDVDFMLERLLDIVTASPNSEPTWWILPAGGDGGASGAPAEVSMTAGRRRKN